MWAHVTKQIKLNIGISFRPDWLPYYNSPSPGCVSYVYTTYQLDVCSRNKTQPQARGWQGLTHGHNATTLHCKKRAELQQIVMSQYWGKKRSEDGRLELWENSMDNRFNVLPHSDDGRLEMWENSKANKLNVFPHAEDSRLELWEKSKDNKLNVFTHSEDGRHENNFLWIFNHQNRLSFVEGNQTGTIVIKGGNLNFEWW